MRVNQAKKAKAIHTHGGGKAKQISTENQLKRSVLACLLWEKEFYEDGAWGRLHYQSGYPFSPCISALTRLPNHHVTQVEKRYSSVETICS